MPDSLIDPFAAAMQRRASLESLLQTLEADLNAVAGNERGPMGLTPDHIKFSPEYRKAKARFNAAFQELRRVNRYLSRHHKTAFRAAIRAEIEERRAAQRAKAAAP